MGSVKLKRRFFAHCYQPYICVSSIRLETFDNRMPLYFVCYIDNGELGLLTTYIVEESLLYTTLPICLCVLSHRLFRYELRERECSSMPGKIRKNKIDPALAICFILIHERTYACWVVQDAFS